MTLTEIEEMIKEMKRGNRSGGVRRGSWFVVRVSVWVGLRGTRSWSGHGFRAFSWLFSQLNDFVGEILVKLLFPALLFASALPSITSNVSFCSGIGGK
ncbi:hypothetical protein SLA2020_163250 [Shorea laevis]